MAARRRRTTTTPKVEPVIEPTHEEMVEIAAEREKEEQVLQMAVDFMEKHDAAFKQLAAIEAAEREEAVEVAEDMDRLHEFLEVMAADTFTAIEEAEEKVEIVEPAPPVIPVRAEAPPLIKKTPRYILRTQDRYRKS